MGDMIWNFITDTSERREIKAHWVPTTLCDRLLDDLLCRFPEAYFAIESPDNGANIEYGGMVHASRKWWAADIGDGLALEIPYDHVFEVEDAAKALAIRKFADGTEYVKLHGWLRCVVMTPTQRDRLLRSIDEHRGEILHQVQLYNATFEAGLRAAEQEAGRTLVLRGKDLADAKAKAAKRMEPKS